MRLLKKYFLLLIILAASVVADAQQDISASWGSRDTLVMPVVNYQGEFLPYRELENVYVSKMSPDELARALAAYQRLRNAV
jgi:hypothetical protein